MNNTRLNYTFDSPTWTPNNCTSNVEYTMKFINGSAVPAFISLNSTNKTISVYTTNVSHCNNYDIEITATLVDLGMKN